MYEQSQELMDEVKVLLEMLYENFVPDLLTEFYVNIPVATLDYTELFVQLCPAENLSLFNYEELAYKLGLMFKAEKDFFQHISAVLMKIMQKETLNDTDR